MTTMDVKSSSEQGDVRCSLCRQRHVFLCEHDTPYRDQYLGTYDETAVRTNFLTGRTLKNETKTMNSGRSKNTNIGVQSQHNKKPDNNNNNKHENHHSTPVNEPIKNSKSCVIL